MNTLPIMEKLLDLSNSAKACLPDSAKACLPDRQVEWKALGDVAEYIRGLVYNKSNESSDGEGYKILRANNINLPEMTLNFNDVKVVSFDTKVKDILKLKKNDILISAASGSREHVGKVAFIHDDIDFYFGGFMGVVRCGNAVTPRFLFHVLISDIFQKYLDEMLNSSTINNLNSKVMGQFLIPIPPLNVQAEIVRILDAFTAYTAELTAELTARKKQYNHYRDQLLSFSETEACLPNRQVEWKTLESIFDIFAGGDVPKDALSDVQTDEFNIPILSNGIGDRSLYGWTTKAKIDKPSLTISARGTIGWTSYRDVPFFPIVRLLVLTPKTKINLKYAYYFMKTIENDYKVPEAGIPQLTKPMLKDIKIPIPHPSAPEKSLQEQARIVAILDKFDALTASISEGLPREIELRQKQYEYYRDRLLSFPKPASDAAV